MLPCGGQNSQTGGISAQIPDDYATRSIERQSRYDSLAPPLQRAHVAAWQRHRDQFGITRTTGRDAARREQQQLLPLGDTNRDRAFLDRELRLIDDDTGKVTA